MFGIGLPELILILALALIVVGPEKLPELARSLAKGMVELKKTANALRDSIQEEMKEEPAGKPPPAGLGGEKSEELAAPEGRPPAEAIFQQPTEQAPLPGKEKRHPGPEKNESDEGPSS